jgi:copper(I)-binding protein
MNKPIITAAFAAAFALMPLTTPARAHDYSAGDLRIGHPWSRATPPGAKVGGGYLKIENKGSTPDRLVAASLERAGRVEIHEMSINDGVMRMRELPAGIAIAGGVSIELKPGGLHLMLTNLGAPLRQGERLRGTLMFERAGTVDVEFVVEAIGAGGGAAAHDH